MEGIPVVFATPRSLRVLNVVAVATSLAACTSAVFMRLLDAGSWTLALVVGVPTSLVGALWAALLRWRKTTRSGIRWGWFLSVPLAALNGALAGGAGLVSVTLTPEEGVGPGSFFAGALVGATFGIVFWGPSLVAVLVAFGLPISRAQRLAKRGLAGEERGELLVGLVSVALAIFALVLARTHGVAHRAYPFSSWEHLSAASAVLFHAFVAIAVACGAATTLIARAREARRRAFLERVERCEEPGFRVDSTALGKVLLRVAPVASYRVADRAEELFEIDDAGRVGHRLEQT